MPWQHGFLPFRGEVMPEAVALSRCIFPRPVGSYHQLSHPLNLLLRSGDWGPENMTEQDPGIHPHKHIFILQLKFLRGPNLRDPIIGNFKEIKRTS